MNHPDQFSVATRKRTASDNVIIILGTLLVIALMVLTVLISTTAIDHNHERTTQDHATEAPSPLVDPASGEVLDIIDGQNARIDTDPAPATSASENAFSPDSGRQGMSLAEINATNQPTTHVTGGMSIKVRSFVNGEAIYTGCSLGPVIDTHRALTAAHCPKALPATVFDEEDNFIGVIRRANANTIDAAVIHLADEIIDTGITVNRIRTTPLKSGETLVKTGHTTGTTAGTLESATGHIAHFNDISTISLISGGCIRAGDSGGLVTDIQGHAVGLVSYTTNSDNEHSPDGTCALPNPTYGFVPIADALVGTGGM